MEIFRIFAVYGDAVGQKQLCRHTIAGNQAAGKTAVVDLTAAAAGAALFENGTDAVVFLGKSQCGFGPAKIFRAHIAPVLGDDPLAAALGAYSLYELRNM